MRQPLFYCRLLDLRGTEDHAGGGGMCVDYAVFVNQNSVGDSEATGQIYYFSPGDQHLTNW